MAASIAGGGVMEKVQRLGIVPYYDIVPSPVGEFYRADDVDALLARIRAAVGGVWSALEAERAEWDEATPGGGILADAVTDSARAALDALLGQGGTDG